MRYKYKEIILFVSLALLLVFREAANIRKHLASYETFHKGFVNAVSMFTIKDQNGVEMVPVLWPGDLSKSNVYSCGYDGQVKNAFAHLYPEHKHKIERAKPFKDITDVNKLSNRDVLLVGYGSPCDRKHSSKWYEQNIKGTVIIFNGEKNYGAFQNLTDVTTIPRNQYHLGHIADGCQSVRMYFMSYFFVGARQIWDYFLLDYKKPKSTQEFFLVYTAHRCVDYRDEAFDAIANSNPNSQVHFAGRCSGSGRNEFNSTVKYNSDVRARGYAENYLFYKKFKKFCLVMENSKRDGYISEKILLAFAGGCVPIYYGTKDIFDIFNPKSFIYYDIENPELALKQISHLHNNATAYNKVMEEPILLEGNTTIQTYFSLSDEIVPDAMQKRKIRNMMYTRCKHD